MPDYAKTVIYKLINYDSPDLVYVGSTTNFTKRKQHHKEGCFNINCKKHNIKLYKTIRENGGWENWNMIIISDYPCNNRREAEQEEDRYMQLLKPMLNMRRAFQTPETRKEYFVNRTDIKKEYDKNRRNGEKAEDIKAKKREAYHIDKEKSKEKNKEAYHRNKEKYSQMITCNCGVIIQTRRITAHEKTTKHQKYVNMCLSTM